MHGMEVSSTERLVLMPRQGNRPRVENPYQDPADVTTIKRTLEMYDYPKLEARYIAREIAQNLRNYLTIMDAPPRRLSDNLTAPVRPTQTAWRNL